MISLFLNTASNFLNIVLFKDNEVLDELYLKLDRDLSKEALFNVKKLLDKNNLTPNEINDIICSRGPGSFTGLRVGVTISKVYSYFLNKKLYSVSTLNIMATSVEGDIIVPLIDARRGFVYGAIYDNNYNVLMEERYIKKDDLIEEANSYNKKVVYVSNDSFEDIEVIKYEPNSLNLIKNINKKEEDPMTFIPNYLKRTEAEENYDKRS